MKLIKNKKQINKTTCFEKILDDDLKQLIGGTNILDNGGFEDEQ